MAEAEGSPRRRWSQSAHLPEPTWLGGLLQDLGAANREGGVPVCRGTLRRVHGEPHGEQGAAAAQVLAIEQGWSGLLIKAEF